MMAETSKLATRLARYCVRLKVRPSVLIAGIVGGGTVLAFPAASALAAVYIALTLAAIGMMAWAGMIALASAAAAALIVPIVAIVTLFGVVAGVRWIVRITSPARAADHSRKEQRPVESNGGDRSKALQKSLDDWETDGGLVTGAAPTTRAAAAESAGSAERKPGRRRAVDSSARFRLTTTLSPQEQHE